MSEIFELMSYVEKLNFAAYASIAACASAADENVVGPVYVGYFWTLLTSPPDFSYVTSSVSNVGFTTLLTKPPDFSYATSSVVNVGLTVASYCLA